MNLSELINRLAKVPRNQRAVIYVGLYVGLILLYVFLGYFPMKTQISDLTVQASEKENDLELVKDKVKTLDDLKKQSTSLKVELDMAQKELPQGTEIPELIKTISETGRKSGLEIRKFQPLQESKSLTNNFVAEVPIALAVQGTFHQVAIFFDRLSKMDRIVHVKDIDIQIEQENSSSVSLLVEGSAITFRFLSDEERQRNNKQKKKRGRR
jgi:type IV pilus assembly protein PilO